MRLKTVLPFVFQWGLFPRNHHRHGTHHEHVHCRAVWRGCHGKPKMPRKCLPCFISRCPQEIPTLVRPHEISSFPVTLSKFTSVLTPPIFMIYFPAHGGHSCYPGKADISQVGLLVQVFQSRNVSWAWDEPGPGGCLLCSVFFGIDCGLTKCCRSSDFLMVLPLRPTVRSLRFFTTYHCKCFPYLLARVQFVFIITLFLEGKGLGLLLYRGNFVMYGAIYVCKRKYNEKHV